MKKSLLPIFAFSMLVFLIACDKENVLPQNFDVPVLPETPYDYKKVNEEASQFGLPNVLINAGNNGEDILINNCFNCEEFGFFNQGVTSDDVATLGRVLFYDKNLSRNNSISCASCHKQNLAFSDGEALSEGFGGKLTTRNSMSIVNPIMNTNFFWDSRSFSLRDLALRPVQNHIEMGMEDIDELATKLSQQDYYKELFEKAYGSSVINSNGLSKALSEFVTSIFKKDSKFDSGLENGFESMSQLEKHGMALFFSQQTQCASCHSGANFSAPTGFNNPYEETQGTANIGLNTVYADDGFDEGKFKIPSLRNIALTAPYMHDGRFETLREVLEHYNDGIKAHDELDEKFIRNGSPVKLGLTDLDLEAMEAFLKTLTSQSITTDERFSNPFQS